MLFKNLIVLCLIVCLQACTSTQTSSDGSPELPKTITELSADLEDARSQTNQLSALVAQQEAEKNQVEQRLVQAQEALRQIESEMKAGEQANEELNTSYLEAKKAVEASQNEMNRQSQEYTEAMAQLSASSVLTEQLEASLAEKNIQVEALERETETLQSNSIDGFVSALDGFLSSLPEGNMIYNTPTRMVKGDKQTITLELSPSDAVENIRQQFAERENVSEQAITIDTIRLSEQMYATLDASSGLGVRSLNSSKVMAISTIAPNVWRWEIEAIEEGEQTLYLQVGVIASINGIEQKPVLIDEPKIVEVAVSTQRTFSEFVSNNWQYLIQVLLLPFAIFLWEQFKKKKKVAA